MVTYKSKKLFDTLEYHHQSVHPSEEQNVDLQNLVRPHIDSFNYFLDEGLKLALANIDSRRYFDSKGNKIEYWIEDVQIGNCVRNEKDHFSVSRHMYPVEVRWFFFL
jgi:DNA-directed RNA polymerase beta subunit